MAGRKILVVEDDQDMQNWLRVQLKAGGHDVVFASDGAQALMSARKEEPDAIILDLGLPAGDGLVVMNRLKGIKPLANVPIIVLTGASDQPGFTERETLAAGAGAFFRKPVDPDELNAAIDRLVSFKDRMFDE